MLLLLVMRLRTASVAPSGDDGRGAATLNNDAGKDDGAIATWCVITPGSLPLDSAGRPVHAHGAGIYSEGDALYLLGTSQKQAVPADSRDPLSPTVYLSDSINLYKTTRDPDAGLCHWEFLGAVFARSTVEAAMHPALPRGMTARVERPKLVKTVSGQYVIWAHVQASNNASYSNIAVMQAPSVTGPYRWSSNFFANGLISKDSTLWTDPATDMSYFVRDTAHLCDSVSELTADGLGVKQMCSHTGPASAPGYYTSMCRGPYKGPGNGTASHPPWVCEGVSVFRDPVDSRLFLLGSHLSNWAANSAMLFVSSEKDLCAQHQNATPWTLLGNPAIGPGGTDTYASQSTFVLPWNASMAVVMMDRWHAPNETLADYVWLPLRRSAGGDWTMQWENHWAL